MVSVMFLGENYINLLRINETDETLNRERGLLNLTNSRHPLIHIVWGFLECPETTLIPKLVQAKYSFGCLELSEILFEIIDSITQIHTTETTTVVSLQSQQMASQ